MNKVILIGRLTNDPEIKNTQAGKQVASYRLAVDRPYKTDGQAEADFLSCVAWGNNATFASSYLKKGMKIAVEGRIQTRSYDGSDGKKVYVTEIMIDRQEFCESKQADTMHKPSSEKPDAGKSEPFSTGYNPEAFTAVESDDLPF